MLQNEVKKIIEIKSDKNYSPSGIKERIKKKVKNNNEENSG